MYNLVKGKLDLLISRINSHKELAKQISGIFYNIPANNPYPFIHLCNLILKNYGIKNDSALEVIFDLTIYAKANDFTRLNQISDLVSQVLTSEQNLIIRSSKINLSNKTNIYENKLNMKFIMQGK